MESALAYLESKCFEDGLKEMLILRNGYVIYSGPETDRSHSIYSCSKSFTSTVLGLLIDEGIVTLDTRAYTLEPALQERYPTVTLRHLTTMTSGYNATGATRWE
jgi:CubicO group peptidase (beta-lactamase class C family)